MLATTIAAVMFPRIFCPRIKLLSLALRAAEKTPCLFVLYTDDNADNEARQLLFDFVCRDSRTAKTLSATRGASLPSTREIVEM
jgi:hypothetical protein